MAKYRNIDSLQDALDDMAMTMGLDIIPYNRSYTVNGQFVDLDKYDLVPKQSYYETLIAEKQEQIGAVEKRLKGLKEEKETLEKNRDNRI